MSNIVSILNGLITTSKDGEQGFRAAAEHTKDFELKSIFQERVNDCVKAVEGLQELITELNEEPTDSGSLIGAMHRGWLDIKTAITGNDDLAILEECERGEDAAKKHYAEALSKELPDNIRLLVQNQYDIVLKNHNLIRDLRNEYKASR